MAPLQGNTLLDIVFSSGALVGLILASIYIHWPGRPEVFAEYTFTTVNKLVPLHVGTAPGKRIEFEISFGTDSLYHYIAGAPELLVPQNDEIQLINQTLCYRSGHVETPFAPYSANVLSAKALAYQFGQVAFCNGYAFLHSKLPQSCTKHEKLAELQCKESFETCTFKGKVTSPTNTPESELDVSFSMTNAQTIVPHKFSDTQTLTIFNNQTLTDGKIDIPLGNVVFGGNSIVLSYRDFASTLVIQQDGHTTIYKGMTDNLTGEAIAYTVLLILVLGYWVQASQQLLDSSIQGLVYGDSSPPVSIFGVGVTRFIVGNTSFSLCIGTLMSLIEVTAYSHQYSPIESDIVLGKNGPGNHLFVPAISFAVNLLAFLITVLGGVWKQPSVADPISYACRTAFETQLLINLVLTVPPPAGQAFRLAFGAFCGTLILFIIGRDGCAIALSRSSSMWLHVVFGTFSCLSIIIAAVDLVSPLVWALRMATLDESLLVSLAWLGNVGGFGAMTTIFKNMPFPTIIQSNTNCLARKDATRFL